MNSYPLLAVGVGLLNLILALMTLGAVARFWLKHRRTGLNTAWWILSLGLAAFAIAQTLEFRRLLTTTEALHLIAAEITARLVFVCVLIIGLWRLFDDALKTKQQSLEAAETGLRLVQVQADSQRQGREIQLLHRLSQSLMNTPDLPGTMEVLCRATRDTLKSTFVLVRLSQPGPGGFHAALDADSKPGLTPETLGPQADGLAAQVIRTGKPAAENVHFKAPARKNGQPSFASLAGFPLLRGRDAVGVLLVGYDAGHLLAADEELLAAAAADHAVTALVHSQRLEQARAATGADSLTGLADRSSFNEALTSETRRAARYGTSLALILFDINGLKACNDRFGRAAGDACLKFFARHLRARARTVDVVARVGADEFAILMPSTTSEGARQAAERFRPSGPTGRHLTVDWEGRPLQISVSLGVAGWNPGESGQGEALIAAAYQSLSADKTLSRQ